MELIWLEQKRPWYTRLVHWLSELLIGVPVLTLLRLLLPRAKHALDEAAVRAAIQPWVKDVVFVAMGLGYITPTMRHLTRSAYTGMSSEDIGLITDWVLRHGSKSFARIASAALERELKWQGAEIKRV